LNWNQFDTFIFSIMIPVTIFVLSVLATAAIYAYRVWKLKKNPYDSRTEAITYLVVVNLVLFFQMFPRIIIESLSVLNCTQVGNDFFLIADLSIQCYTDNFNSIATLATIVIIVYGIFIPVGVVFFIYRYRLTQDSALTMKRFGFFYNKYEDKYFYWELVVLLAKVFVVIVLVYASYSQLVKITVIAFIFFTAMVLEMKISPYKEYKHNICVQLTLLAVFFSALCGIYFLFHSLSNFSDALDTTAIDVIIVIVNSGVLAVIFLLFCFAVRNTVLDLVIIRNWLQIRNLLSRSGLEQELETPKAEKEKN